MLLHNWKNDLLLTSLLDGREARLHSEERHWRWLLIGAPDLGFPVQPGEKLHLQSAFWRGIYTIINWKVWEFTIVKKKKKVY